MTDKDDYRHSKAFYKKVNERRKEKKAETAQKYQEQQEEARKRAEIERARQKFLQQQQTYGYAGKDAQMTNKVRRKYIEQGRPKPPEEEDK